MSNGAIRYVTLQKVNDNQSFGFVIISSQNKAGATVGKSTHSVIAFAFAHSTLSKTDNNGHKPMDSNLIHKVWIGQILHVCMEWREQPA